jgi:hypothetical protein
LKKIFSNILVSYFLSSRQWCFQLKLFKLDRKNKIKIYEVAKMYVIHTKFIIARNGAKICTKIHEFAQRENPQNSQ